MPLRKISLPAEQSSEQSQSTQRDLDRPTAIQIYEQVALNGRRELARTNLSLAISGLAGGLAMGLTGLSVSIVLARLGESPAARFIAFLLYPMGFMATILGRSQLFTENTLYPVALILDERRHLLATLRLWGIVFSANVAGALVFAILCARTKALEPQVLSALAQLGFDAANHPARHIFWSGVVGGWIIATVAWMVSGSHSITGAVALIWSLTFIVGLGHFAHCIATSGEILVAVLAHRVPAAGYLKWLLPATLGNITGGVTLVTLLEYGQSKLR
ncbi:MAG: formate/nitrite transporter family protein [Acidobacteriaceae bacterium]|nr:formate/nitrite transporter family protein [Acidobacteriaceae bacterium]